MLNLNRWSCFILALIAALFALALAVLPASAQTIFNGSFESNSFPSGVGYASQNGGVISGWTISNPNNTGLNTSAGPFANNGAIPDGANVAFIQSYLGLTNSLSTTISNLVPGTIYQVTFRANCRDYQANPTSADWSLNGGEFVPFTAAPPVGGSNPYYLNAGAFVATSNTAPLILRNGLPTGDATLLLDDFRISTVVTVVTTTADSGLGSLRQTIADAPDGSTITFDASLSGQTITLTGGELLLNKNITLLGLGPNQLAINGNYPAYINRAFEIASGKTVTLAGLTITNAAFSQTDFLLSVSGGGILNQGTLTVSNCIVSGNRSLVGASPQQLGGGIDNIGTLTIVNSTLSGNLASGSSSYGGGIYNSGVLTINNSTLSGNVAYYGGGIYTFATLTINNSTLSGNSANSQGGGIYNLGRFGTGTINIYNSTLKGNTAPDGSGIFNSGFKGNAAANIYSCTLSTNGVKNDLSISGSAVTQIGSTILNAAPISNTGGTVTSLGYNLASDNGGGVLTQPTDQINTNPLLGPLQNNGGPTLTHALLLGSPAIEHGSNFSASATDQRGLPRVLGSAPDVGAVEAGSSLIVTVNTDSGAGSLREAVQTANSAVFPTTITFTNTLSGQTITLTSGQLSLSNAVAIDASSLLAGISVSGNNSSRVMEIASGGSVTLESLTLKNGSVTGAVPAGAGGGILVDNGAALTVHRSTIASNTASTGGGIYCLQGTLTVNSSTLTGNSATGTGFGGFGGGLYLFSSAGTINQSTISGNTITAGAFSGGGGLALYSSAVTLSNSIVAGNTASDVIAVSGSGPAGSNNLTSGNPQLAPLGNYGGPTQTMPPLPGSPVIDGATGGTSFATDQRGLPRIVGAFADLGAVEGVFNPAFPLVNGTKLVNGNVQFGFTNLSGPTYRVLASTNVAAPLNTWSNLGAPTEAPAGTFTFTDPAATNYPQRFYRVTTP